MTTTKLTEQTQLPLLPLRDVVVFPHMVIPLFVGRPKSIKALEAAMEQGKSIMLAAQKAAAKDEPSPSDIYEIGCVANILQMLKLPDGTVKVLVEGAQRARIKKITDSPTHFIADLMPLESEQGDESEIEAMRRAIVQQFDQYVKLNKKIPPEILASLSGIDDAGRLADTVAAHLPLKLEQKQVILEIIEVSKRLEHLLGQLEGELDILQVEKRIRGRVKRQMEKSQREYYLNEQVKAIQKELGEGEEGADIDELEKKVVAAKMPKEALEKAQAELKKLKLMSPMSAEATVVRNYIDTLVSLPWKKKSKVNNDLANAEKVLDHDHYGLEKIKERIVEYLAVQQRVDKLKAPILCFVGPPGVGKTSLGQSIAKATNRKYVRMALGGVRDEAEIRGHRRTYIGSMPGKVLQSLSKVGVRNPLFLLDEIDKMGRGLPRRSVVGPAGSAGSRAEPHLLGPLHRSRLRPVRCDVRGDFELVQHPAGTAGPYGSDPLVRLHGRREDQHLLALPVAEAGQEQRLEGRGDRHQRRCCARHHPLLHAGSRRAFAGARNLQDLPQGREDAAAEEVRQEGQRYAEKPGQVPGRAPLRLWRGREDQPGWDRWSAWHGPKWAATC